MPTDPVRLPSSPQQALLQRIADLERSMRDVQRAATRIGVLTATTVRSSPTNPRVEQDATGVKSYDAAGNVVARLLPAHPLNGTYTWPGSGGLPPAGTAAGTSWATAYTAPNLTVPAGMSVLLLAALEAQFSGGGLAKSMFARIAVGTTKGPFVRSRLNANDGSVIPMSLMMLYTNSTAGAQTVAPSLEVGDWTAAGSSIEAGTTGAPTTSGYPDLSWLFVN